MQTYKIIGADQKEYGPISGDQIRAWIAQRRANADTRVRSEAGGDWQRLGDLPEFSQEFRTSVPPLPSPQKAERPQTSNMAITSLVLGIMGVFTCGLSAIPGLIFGVLAMRGIQKSNKQLTGHGIALAGTIVSVFSLFLIPILAAMLLPALARAKEKAQTISCVNNVKILALGAHLYSAEHTNFPPALNWCDAMTNEVPHHQHFKCPAAKDAELCHYAFNSKLEGLDAERVPADTVMFFEVEGGWNQSGGPESMIHTSRHRNVFVVGFADGSVRQVRREELSSLRWDPGTTLLPLSNP